MRQLFDKTTKRLKKKAGKSMDILQLPSRQGGSASPAPSQQAEDQTSLASEEEARTSNTTVTASLAQLAPGSISVATDSSQRIKSATTEPAPPPANEVTPTIPAHLNPPSSPTILATTGSAVKGLLKAARDGSDLFLPLKATLVGIVALWDIFDVRHLALLASYP